MPRILPTGFQTMEQTAEYKTLAHFGTDSFVEQRSEFIGYASPCETEEQALAFLQSIRTKHADARHCVYAYVLRENHISRFSDDHEPQGTAGMPTLSILQHGQITDACIAVVRYFGGILLGTGGLTRAYTKSAMSAMQPLSSRFENARKNSGEKFLRKKRSFSLFCVFILDIVFRRGI